MWNVALLVASGFVAGAMNAFAGGGSFLTLPVLIFVGLPSVPANASSTVALFPGSLTSAWAYRRELAGVGGVPLKSLLAVSLVGGLAGALLLLFTPQAAFDAVLPWLLLVATLALTLGGKVVRAPRHGERAGTVPMLAAQLLLAIYGGYFGGAVGIMLLATWSMLGSADLKAMNPAKTLLVGAMNSVAIVCFCVAGKVWWFETLTMMVAAAVGGYVGARVSRRMEPRWVRLGVTVITVTMTVVFFVRRART
jgi:uncharacterized membrane protein YfcA